VVGAHEARPGSGRCDGSGGVGDDVAHDCLERRRGRLDDRHRLPALALDDAAHLLVDVTDHHPARRHRLAGGHAVRADAQLVDDDVGLAIGLDHLVVAQARDRAVVDESLLGEPVQHRVDQIGALHDRAARDVHDEGALAADEPQRLEIEWEGADRLSLMVQATPLPGDPCPGVVLVLHDTTELRRLESLRRDFVANVSHELKTPLTNIRMYADLLEMDLEKLEAEDAERPLTRLEVIISESQRLTRLITNVLTFARAERQQLQINRQPAIVDDVVRRVIDRFRPSLAAKQFQIEADLQAESEALFDPDILEQIVGNLISNVDRYATDGKWIKVTTRRGNDLVTVSIEDRGPGIQPQLQQKVFEPFYRVSNRLNDANGTGIGLSISRQLAQLHGGNLTLQSPKDGSIFNLTLRCGTSARAAASNVSSASNPTCVTEPQ